MKEQLHNTIIEQDILDTLRYFIFFNYIPTFEEIYTFLKKKLSKRRLANILEKMKGKEIVKMSLSLERYTLGEYSKKTQNIKLKIRNSDCKINKIQLYIQILSFFPQIKLVGLSGTVAMMNAKEKDDIDLFIISAKKRIWT
ncbi:hypothetical protein HY041_03145, partial [Candidatus Roizmanbacteria bacterium]|nr:hypothetical protein [Candidatus Roizmanbacteria bacterium]